MKVVVVGLGVQGLSAGVSGRRLRAASIPSTRCGVSLHRGCSLADYGAPSAAFRWPKQEILSYCLRHASMCWSRTTLDEIDRGDQRAREARPQQGRRLLYAYNHRFEPHFMRMRELVASGVLAHLFLPMFYGNGTAARAGIAMAGRRAGVLRIPVASSRHERFWFGDLEDKFEIYAANCFENRAPDHVSSAVNGCRCVSSWK